MLNLSPLAYVTLTLRSLHVNTEVMFPTLSWLPQHCIVLSPFLTENVSPRSDTTAIYNNQKQTNPHIPCVTAVLFIISVRTRCIEGSGKGKLSRYHRVENERDYKRTMASGRFLKAAYFVFNNHICLPFIFLS